MVMMIPANLEPYHTSILTGQMWVDKLLEGHPDRIYCELGVRREVFLELVCTLRNFGVTGSKHISLDVIDISVHVHDWTDNPPYWRALPALKQHDLKIISKNVVHILISTILHYLCHPSQCRYPPFTTNPLQQKNVALLSERTWGHRWQSHPMCTTNDQTWLVPQSKRFYVSELSVYMLI